MARSTRCRWIRPIAYLIEILPAMSYLHTMGLLYCDFKPDNVIQEGDALKLIDLGGVRRIDDTTSAIYGTVGFQAPEVATLGPSIASDVFTVARTLAVLVLDFRGYQSTFVTTLPPLDDVPLFQRHDSLYRYLLKGTAPDPNDRFQSADEMREQLLGVLREVVAVDRAATARTTLVATPSAVFGDPAIATAALTWRDLPALRPDPADAATAWLSGVSIADPVERLAALDAHADQTREVALAAIVASIEAGDTAGAQQRIGAVLDTDPWEWRAIWFAGLAALAAGDANAAVSSFNAVYGAVPGELAPKLALAHACELQGALGNAVRLYEVCARTDAAYVAPGCFGMARVEAGEGNLSSALDALDRIPTTSRAYVEARRHAHRAAARCRARPRHAGPGRRRGEPPRARSARSQRGAHPRVRRRARRRRTGWGRPRSRSAGRRSARRAAGPAAGDRTRAAPAGQAHRRPP